ncbi:hypothetical protein ACLOJK_020968 [Asimina triloba]
MVLIWGRKRPRFWCGALIFAVLFLWATPKFHHSPNHHLFADMRNFLGVPNTLNVISTFPLLVFGILGLVLCLHGNCLGISLRGEVLGWTFFYAGIAASAFGSAYYHLKPDDVRALWDRLPLFVRWDSGRTFDDSFISDAMKMNLMMIAVTSLLSILVIERFNERLGVTCFISALVLVLIGNAYERTFNDLRLVFIFYSVPCMAIPVLAFLFPPKYTHSIYWLWAAGAQDYCRVKNSALPDPFVFLMETLQCSIPYSQCIQ